MSGTTYKDAGVNIAAGEEAVNRIKELVASTHQPWVRSNIGPFGSLIDLDVARAGFKHPADVQTIDGAGTKTMIAEAMNTFDTIGTCLVHHCANDLITWGPVKLISFLDYIGAYTLSPDVYVEIMTGMVQACLALGCAIVGGEMAEMPSVYQEGRHEIVGHMAGIVERKKIIDGSAITPGNIVIGLASSGLHTNGFTLAREVLFEEQHLHVGSDVPELSLELGFEMLRPHRCYVNPILAALDDGVKINGIAHVTGGGIAGNLIRVLPDGCMAVVHKNRWQPQPIFRVIQGDNWVDEDEMYRVFNMGIGMIVVVPSSYADWAVEILDQHLRAQESNSALDGHIKYAFQIGAIEKYEKGVELI